MSLEQIEITTSIAIDLPYVLLEYLIDLANQQQDAGYHTFLLRVAYLGSKQVQDIWHYSDSKPHGDYQRILGFPPVDCQVNMDIDTTGVVISFNTLAASAI